MAQMHCVQKKDQVLVHHLWRSPYVLGQMLLESAYSIEMGIESDLTSKGLVEQYRIIYRLAFSDLSFTLFVNLSCFTSSHSIYFLYPRGFFSTVNPTFAITWTPTLLHLNECPNTYLLYLRMVQETINRCNKF